MIGTCEVCGQETYRRRLMYCSNACKMRAYRRRKKQQKKAQENTMRLEDSALLTVVTLERPDFKYAFDGFLSEFGLDASVEMLHIVASEIGLRAKVS